MNYAIAKIKGKQFKLFEKKYIYVPFFYEKKLGEKLIFNQVLLFCKNGMIKIGTPFLKEIRIQVEIIEHKKGKKIIVFKKKRRKGYKKKNGFRPIFSKIKIISFLEK
ncbi:50S ribosomal protein L21 [Blattabacterium cuenoti]